MLIQHKCGPILEVLCQNQKTPPSPLKFNESLFKFCWEHCGPIIKKQGQEGPLLIRILYPNYAPTVEPDQNTSSTSCLNVLLQLLDPNNYVINSDNVMFIYTPSQLQEDIIDIIMIMKHVLYRLKFCENRNVFPPPRMATVIAALELEKIIKVRNYMNKDATFITNFTKNLKTRARF